MNGGKFWTRDETEVLRRLASQGLTFTAIGHQLGRSEESIKKKANREGFYKSGPRPHYQPWTEDECAQLIKMSRDPTTPTTEIMEQFRHRTEYAVRSKAAELGHPLKRRSWVTWEPSKIAELERYWKQGLGRGTIAKLLGVSEGSIRSKERALGMCGETIFSTDEIHSKRAVREATTALLDLLKQHHPERIPA
jgi:hypothetical protein